MHANSQRVVDAARALGLDVEISEFPDGTRTAEDAAKAIGVTVGQIAKSLVFVADDETVLAVMSGSNRLDERRLATHVGAGHCRKADADATRAATGYPIGGVPPFGHTTALRTFVDRDLLAYDVVWVAGGTPRACFPMDPADLVRSTRGTVADLRQE